MLKISELLVGGSYRVVGTVTLESAFTVKAKEELKNGKIFLLIQFMTDIRGVNTEHGNNSIVWETYAPDQITSFTSYDW